MPSHNSIRAHDDESLFPSGPELSRQHPENPVEYCQPRSGTSSLQCRELLTKGEVFEQQRATSPKKAKNYAYELADSVDHAMVLPQFACGRQRCILLNSPADRILAKHSGLAAVNHCKFDGRPGSIPTAATNHLPDWSGLNKFTRGQKGADRPIDPVLVR